MHQFFQQTIFGFGSGAASALLALGLVLTYRGSGVLNFAQGAIATAATYTFLYMHNAKWSSWFAIPASILVAALIGLVFEYLVMRKLRNAPTLAKVVATLGLMVTLISAIPIVFDNADHERIELVSGRPVKFGFGSPEYYIPLDRLTFLAIAAVVTCALWAIYRFTNIGRATRGSAENERAITLLGYSPGLLSSINWGFGAALSGGAGVLLASVIPPSPTAYTSIIVAALAGALIGGFRSFGITFAACMFLGAGGAVVQNYAPVWGQATTILGWGDIFPFVVIAVVMIFRGQSLPVRGSLLETSLPAAPAIKHPRRFFPVIVVVGVIWLLVSPFGWLDATSASLIGGVICLSIVVLTGYLGQISLAQLTLAGVGTFVGSKAAISWDMPFPLPLIIGGLAAVPVGLALALPALRVRGINLAVITLSAAYAAESAFFGDSRVAFGMVYPLSPSPELFGLSLDPFAEPRRFAIMCLVVVVIMCGAVAILRQSKWGVRLLAVRANERGAAALGVSSARAKLLAFGIAAFIAGVGGALFGYRLQQVDSANFAAFSSLLIISIVYMAGVGAIQTAFIGGLIVSGGLVSHWLTFSGSSASQIVQLIGGIGVLLTVVAHPDGLALLPRDMMERFRHVRAKRRVPLPKSQQSRAELAATVVSEELVGTAAGPTGLVLHKQSHFTTAGLLHPRQGRQLVAEHLTLSYGAVHAVKDISFVVPPGQLVGLIGPNGAGKTSTIDALTGFAPRARGEVRLGGERMDGWSPTRRARHGLIRTFQGLEIFDDLSVAENLEVAQRNSDRESSLSSASALKMFGLDVQRHRLARELPQGDRRLLALARAMACSPDVLVLDEPAAGLDTDESKHLGTMLRAVVDSGIGILLVDHDMSLVLTVCDHILVMDFGAMIAAGEPSSIRQDELVLTAYLGASDDA